MDFRNYTFSIVIQLVMLTTTGFGAAYFMFETHQLVIGLLVISLTIPEIVYLLYTVNRSSRTMTLFFEAVQNEDTSLKFPENVGNKILNGLHKSLNRINCLIREAKMQNEYRERFYHTLIEHSASGLVAVNERGQFEIISNKAKQFLGVKHTSSLQSLKHQNEELHVVFKDIKGGESKTVRIHHNNEILLLLIKASEIKYDNKKVKLISLDNIKQELDEKELDSWQKLIRVLTHEIMNSVAPIASMSNTLLGLYKKNGNELKISELKEKSIKHTIGGLEVIKERGDGLIDFVKNYRSLTKIPQPDFTTLNVNEWTENLRILLSDLILKNSIEFTVNIERGIKEIVVDKTLFTQLMINLINNSIDALENIVTKKIDVVIERNFAGKIVIKITDNGCGIPKDLLEKIFIPFYTTKDNGSGIGLSLSRQILRAHGGSLAVYSEENKGSTFLITL